MNNENTNYKNIASFSLNEKKEQNLISLLFLLIAGIGGGLIFFTKSYENNTLPPWKIILSIIGFILVHELIHIFFMTVFAKGKVKVKVKFPTIAVGSDAYFNKRQYIIIALAPVFILGILTSITCFLFSYEFLFTILLVFNFASASGDYLLTFYALKQKKKSFFVDTAEETLVYMKEK